MNVGTAKVVSNDSPAAGKLAGTRGAGHEERNIAAAQCQARDRPIVIRNTNTKRKQALNARYRHARRSPWRADHHTGPGIGHQSFRFARSAAARNLDRAIGTSRTRLDDTIHYVDRVARSDGFNG